MSKRYWVLIERNEDGLWSPEFGDYDKECVEQERLDRHESYPNPKLKDLRVICSGDAQGSINAAVAVINARARS